MHSGMPWHPNLVIGHFINLETSAFEQDPVETIGGGATSIPSDYNGTCNLPW